MLTFVDFVTLPYNIYVLDYARDKTKPYIALTPKRDCNYFSGANTPDARHHGECDTR